VTISLDVKSQKEVTLSLSYVINGASWKSRYDLRVNSAKKSCILNYLGIISNSTGEDWINVNLHLSTASPALGGFPPKLYPLKIDYRIQTFKEKGSRNRSSSISSIRLESDDKKERKSASSGPKLQQLESKVRSTKGSTSITYEIRRKVKISSDSKPHKVPITEIQFNLEFQHIVMPSKGSYAYLKAKTINDSNYQLLEGEMNVFIDEYFVTTSKLQQTVQGDTINMYLGIDSGVKVNVKPVVKHESTSGGLVLTAKKSHQDLKRVTEITNHKNFDISVLVYQELPFSIDESIRIKKEDPSDNVKNVEIDNFSILCWNFNIPMGETKKTNLHYTLEYPAENKIYFVKQDGKPAIY